MDDFMLEIRNRIRKTGQRNLRLAKENGTKFYIGRVSISDELQELGYSYDTPVIQECFTKYINGDYGHQPEEDIEINERAIASGYGDVMGEYYIDGHKVWIKTDLNEDTTTTIFLPEEW